MVVEDQARNSKGKGQNQHHSGSNVLESKSLSQGGLSKFRNMRAKFPLSCSLASFLLRFFFFGGGGGVIAPFP